MFAVLGPDGSLQETASTLEGAVEEAYSSGAKNVIVDSAAEPQREANPATAKTAAAAVQQLRLSPGAPVLHIPDSAIDMDIREAHARLKPLMPPFKQTGKTGKERDFYPAKSAPALAESLLGQNAKMEKKAGAAENVDVVGINLVPYWMFASTAPPAGLGHTGSMQVFPNLCAGSSPACRHSCLVFAGQNYAADWSIFSKFQKTKALFHEPEAFGRMLYNACIKHECSSRADGFIPMVRLNVLSDIPWELVFPALFKALPTLQFYDYTKVHGRKPPSNYDLTFSTAGNNLPAVKAHLLAGGRVAAVVHIPEWELGAAARDKGVPSKQADPLGWAASQVDAKHRLWSDRLPKSCSVDGRSIPVVDGDITDVRPLDPKSSIVALRWKRPGGQASWRGDKGRALALKTKFIVQVEQFCNLTFGAVTPSEQPDTAEETIYSLTPLEAAAENPGGRTVMVSRRSNPDRGSALDLVRRLKF